jgi:hypothetical protein
MKYTKEEDTFIEQNTNGHAHVYVMYQRNILLLNS